MIVRRGKKIFLLVLRPEGKITKIREIGDINTVSRIKQNTSMEVSSDLICYRNVVALPV
jgi:hypothetical protein